MRIISGKFRGVSIPSPKEGSVRPTLDRVKENLFNILQFKVAQARCLDLFCGSGAFGLECLSRGAASVDFVDNDKRNIQVLQEFLVGLKVENCLLHSGDFSTVLGKFGAEKRSFDIIFLDPPFKEGLAKAALSQIFRLGLLKSGGVVVYERDKDSENPFSHKVVDSRSYGKISLDFMK